MSIYVSVETNITLFTNLTQPASFVNFTNGNMSVFYEITLDNESALDNATIRFHYNESLLNGTLEVNLAIYVYRFWSYGLGVNRYRKISQNLD